jgi:hypothetical protein
VADRVGHGRWHGTSAYCIQCPRHSADSMLCTCRGTRGTGHRSRHQSARMGGAGIMSALNQSSSDNFKITVPSCNYSANTTASHEMVSHTGHCHAGVCHTRLTFANTLVPHCQTRCHWCSHSQRNKHAQQYFFQQNWWSRASCVITVPTSPNSLLPIAVWWWSMCAQCYGKHPASPQCSHHHIDPLLPPHSAARTYQESRVAPRHCTLLLLIYTSQPKPKT